MCSTVVRHRAQQSTVWWRHTAWPDIQVTHGALSNDSDSARLCLSKGWQCNQAVCWPLPQVHIAVMLTHTAVSSGSRLPWLGWQLCGRLTSRPNAQDMPWLVVSKPAGRKTGRMSRFRGWACAKAKGMAHGTIKVQLGSCSVAVLIALNALYSGD